MEDGFDIIQYQVKRLCNKSESDTDFTLYFGQVDFNFRQVEN